MSIDRNGEDHLSSVAESMLDEYLTEYRQRIVRKAQELDRQQGGSGSVAAPTVMRAISTVESSSLVSAVSPRIRAWRRVGLLYAFVGLIVVIVSLTVYVVQQQIELNDFNWPLVTSLGGALAAVTGLFVQRYATLRMDDSALGGYPYGVSTRASVGQGEAVTGFIEEWRDFERLIRSIEVPEGDTSTSRRTLAQQLATLTEAGLLLSDELAAVRTLLDRRNELAHGKSPSTPQDVRRDTVILHELGRTLRTRALEQ